MPLCPQLIVSGASPTCVKGRVGAQLRGEGQGRMQIVAGYAQDVGEASPPVDGPERAQARLFTTKRKLSPYAMMPTTAGGGPQ